MKKEVIASGKDLTEARENARLALGAGELDDVTFETIDLGSRGIFGIIGVRPAKVKASMEVADAEPRREVRRPREAREGAPRRERAPRRESDRAAGTANNVSRAPKAPRPKSEEKPAAVPEEALHFTHVDAAPGDDRALDFVNTLIADLGLTDVETELLRCDDGTRRVSIKGENASLLIGHHGDTLDALQYLANLATSQKDENGERDRSRVTIDIEGYRAKREQTLRRLARRMANKALSRGSKVTLEPMTPYERRIIHSEVQSIEGVTTQSIGSDSSRRVVIYPEQTVARNSGKRRSASRPTPKGTPAAEATVDTAEEISTEVTEATDKIVTEMTADAATEVAEAADDATFAPAENVDAATGENADA